MALYASVAGDVLATLVLIVVAEPLARMALRSARSSWPPSPFSPSPSLLRSPGGRWRGGSCRRLLGVLVAMIGMDAETATPRLTFGLIELPTSSRSWPSRSACWR